MTKEMKSHSECGTRWKIALCVGVFWMYSSTTISDAACGRPGRATVNRPEPNGNLFNATNRIRYKCNDPSDVLIGSSERECLGNGSWSGKMPVCFKSVKVEEAEQSSEDPKEEVGLLFDGNISTCVQIPVIYWEGSLTSSTNIFAVQIALSGKEEVELETMVKNDTSPDIKCKTDSITEGENKMIAMAYCPAGTVGKYLHIRSLLKPLSICEISILLPPAPDCLTPDIPAYGNGRLIVKEQHAYQFNCNSGYQLWGEATVICQEDGTWLPKTPVCKSIYCRPPDKPMNGNVEYDLTNSVVPYNGVARYSCNEGFYLEGESTIVCYRYDIWAPSEPKCIPRTMDIFDYTDLNCGKLPEIANGILISNSTVIGSRAWLKCNPGFKPLTDDHMYCLQTGEWDLKSLICTVIQCESNPVVPNGVAIFLNNSSYYGAHLQIKCNQGFTSREDVIHRCEEYGTWGNLNVCTEITCGTFVPEGLSDGEWIILNETNSVRILVCSEGFHIEGSPPMTRCLTNGTWSYTSAKCKSSSAPNLWSSSIMLIVAVSVGTAIAIFILCSSITFLIIGRRRKSKENVTVFHLEKVDSFSSTDGKEERTPRKDYRSRQHFEDSVELRPKPVCTNPRKPHSALPNLPLDADPVYAQPFEPAATKKISVPISKHDFYNTHIYAEPVDSRTQSLYANDVSHPRIGTENEIASLKINIRNGSLAGLGCDKKCSIYDTSTNLDLKNSTSSATEKCQNNAVETFVKNSEYIGFL